MKKLTAKIDPSVVMRQGGDGNKIESKNVEPGKIEAEVMSLQQFGRWGKYVPKRMLQGYLESQEDPELLNLRSDIALLDTRIKELSSGIPEQEPTPVLEKMADSIYLAMSAIKADEPNKAMAPLNKAVSMVNSRLTDKYVWQEITELIEQRRKLADTERRRLIDLQQTMTKEQAIAFAAALVTILNDTVREVVERMLPDANLGQLIITTIRSTTAQAVGKLVARGSRQEHRPESSEDAMA